MNYGGDIMVPAPKCRNVESKMCALFSKQK